MTNRFDLLLYGPQVLTPDGIRPAQVGVQNDRITAVEPMTREYADLGTYAARVYSLGASQVLIPGLVDINTDVAGKNLLEDARTTTITKAAFAGGVTRLVDAPSRSGSTTSNVAELRAKRRGIEDQLHADVGFWGGPAPLRSEDIESLLGDGVFGIEVQSVADLDALLRQGLNLAGTRTLLNSVAGSQHDLEQVAELIRRSGVAVHVAHVSSESDIKRVRAAKDADLPLTASVDSELLLPLDPLGPAAPRDATGGSSPLWDGLADGSIDTVTKGAGSTSGSHQLWLKRLWTEAWRRGFSLPEVLSWVSRRPAQIAGMANIGQIAPGFEADLIIFSPERGHTIEEETLLDPVADGQFVGRSVMGTIDGAYLRGHHIDERTAKGKLLLHVKE